MLDIGMSEMVVIGVVALIVVGPKDLPQMFRKVGNFVGKARGMARDFQTAMHDAAEQSGVNDIKSSFDQAASLKDLGLDNLGASEKYSSDLKPAADVPSVKPPAEVTKKLAAKKAATKKAAAKAEATAKKPAVKKSPVKKPVVKAAPAKKPAAKKAPAKKPAAKKPAAKKAT
jgi:sec-independent protein translocase protein TatB